MKTRMLLAVLLVAASVRGDIINDHESGTTKILAGVGQSFIAIDPLIEVVSISIHSLPAASHFALVIYKDIEQGIVVAETTSGLIPNARTGWLDFQFINPVSLKVGIAYSIFITSDEPNARLHVDRLNNYPDGQIFSSSSSDLRFRVLTTPLPGACCIENGCLDDIDEELCEALMGTYNGNGRSCDDNASICFARACCTDVGCFQLTEADCVARDDWQDWTSYCSSCTPPLGACCFTGVCIADLTGADCLSVSADWAGPLTDCESCPPCEGPDFDGDGAEDNCDTDIDNDGIRNEDDVCDFTPLGLSVQANGTVPADLDGDCDVDLHDYAIWQLSLTGP